MLGALGVVYGDIGTSPLYAMREAFGGTHPMPADERHIFGVLSLIVWALVLVVSLKYAYLMLRADNKGQGGSLALLALVTQAVQQSKLAWLMPVVIALGISAGALFYGDSMLTPAMTVMSAVEGLNVALPAVGDFVILITLGILISLFVIQRHGSRIVGKLFGPVMVLWFAALAGFGVVNIARAPEVLAAFSPTYAIGFFIAEPGIGFFSLGAVFLVLTGSEALYADMGHFGRAPIRRAWFGFVLPALLLNYFGQGALLLRSPEAASNPFYLMFPSWATLPMVVVATMAAIIASQAVITGAFSVTRQAMQLGFLPRMKTVHTSETEIGQIYIPFVNWTLMVFVAILVLGFQSSTSLAHAYGVAVSATLLIDTVLVSLVIFLLWRWNKIWATLITVTYLIIDLAFVGSNALKIPTGGWFPLAMGAVVFLLLTTWKKGRAILFRRMAQEAMPVELFLSSLNPNVTRVSGTAVFLSGTTEGVPHALLHNLKHNRVVHERVVFLTVVIDEVPHVPEDDRLEIQHLGRRFYRFIIRYGFLDETNIPVALKSATKQNFEFNDMETSFFLGRETLIPSRRPGMALWRESLFAWMSRSATSAMAFFHLPPNRVVEMGTQVEI